MNNENKVTTSIQYEISNVTLFYLVFDHWSYFNQKLNQGPEEMKKYLYETWNKLRDGLKANDKVVLKDLDKEVKIEDFNVTYNKTKNGTSVYFITFPDHDYIDAASKYVAVALTPNMPRYFTLEYSMHVMDSTPCWVVGEFVPEGKGKKHLNYGTSDNMRIEWFAGRILGMLESQNL